MTRKIVVFVFLTVAMIYTASRTFGVDGPRDQNKPEREILGTWKLVSAKYGNEEIKLEDLGTTPKHITSTQFMWVSYNAETKLISRTSGGTWKTNGDQYVETTEYGLGNDFEQLRGKEHTFTLRIEGDTWFHNGALANGLKIEEKWERIKR
jgi:hypothetical protein